MNLHNQNTWIIGELKRNVLALLKMDLNNANKNIYLSESSVLHIKSKHIDAYDKYYNQIENIISAPDYVAKNPRQNSIEYIKEYTINNEHVIVAVRLSNKGNCFVRSMYIMNPTKVEIYKKNGYMLQLRNVD